MAVNIGPKIGVEGEPEYRTAINNIIQQQKTLNAEMQKAAAVFNKDADAKKKSAAQMEILNKQIANQKERVSQLQTMYEKSLQKTGENSTATLKWKQALAEAETELAKMENQLQSMKGPEALADQLEASGKKLQDLGKQISGVEQNRPRWKRVTGTVEGAMGEALGKLYVEKHFPAEAKTRMETLVHNLITALGQRIDMATWMTDSTKANAHKKLETIYVKIGYPNKWRDYSKLDIKNDSYYANVVRSNEFDMEYMFSKINKPVDKDEWLMTPQTVNAYYNPTTILQPPFFNMQADEAANYGAIGVVIGHELTHGFDDQGRQYDEQGNLNDWWTETDAKNFDNNKQALIDAFSAVKVLEDGGNGEPLYGNGQLTLGENIADNGGLHVSYLAMQNAMQQGQVNKEKMDNFTPEQRFFLAYAAVWASNINDEGILNLTQNDVHSLGRNRVNVALPQITEFIEAFGIKEGDGMWLAPEKRAQLW